MHALWKGSIAFGLVNIPIRMYVAARDREFKFVMLHNKDHSEIRYARICKEDGEEVPWKDIVKGYEYTKGEYLILTEEDLKKIGLERAATIDIVEFVDEKEIDPIFYNKPYYLEPDKGGAQAYTLLREALRKSKKVGIAKYVFHNREHIAVLKPYENTLVLNQLRYFEEMVSPKTLEIPESGKTSEKEIDIAMKLIEHLTQHFKPKDFQDPYFKEMEALIEKKAKGKRIPSKAKPVKPSKITDMMSLLKASLSQNQKKKRRAAS